MWRPKISTEQVKLYLLAIIITTIAATITRDLKCLVVHSSPWIVINYDVKSAGRVYAQFADKEAKAQSSKRIAGVLERTPAKPPLCSSFGFHAYFVLLGRVIPLFADHS